MIALFVGELLSVRQLGMMGATDARIEHEIFGRFARFIVGEQLAILGVYVALGLGAALVATATLTLWDRALAREVSRRRRWLTVALIVMGIELWRSAVAVIEYPQLYAETLYLRGGWRRALQVALTEHAPRAWVDGAGWLALAVLLVGPFATARGRMWIRTFFQTIARRAPRRGAAAAALLVIATAAGVGRRHARAAINEPAAAGDRPNILVIAVDSLRADRVGPAHADVAPHLAALAQRGVELRSAYVTVPRTFPSWMTLLTGRWPEHHGVRTMFPDAATRSFAVQQFPALPSQLAAHGYRTAVVSDFAGEIFARADVGFGERAVPLFNLRTVVAQAGLNIHPGLVPYSATALGHRALPSLEAAGDNADPARLADRVIATFEPKNDNDRGRPFFITAFFSGCHFPYAAPDPWYRRHTSPDYTGAFRYHKPPPVPGAPDVELGDADVTQVRALYDGAVGATDAAIGRVLDALEKAHLSQNTIVVVLADHGENLYEPGRGMAHGEHLHGDKTLHIPLLIFDPVHKFPAHAASDIVRDIDLAPTLSALAGVPFAGGDGVSLLPLLRGEKDSLDLVALAETELWLIPTGPGFGPDERLPYPGIPATLVLENGDDIVLAPWMKELVVTAKHRALRTAQWKLTYEPTRDGVHWELYDTIADPDERTNVASQHNELLVPLQKQLLDWSILDGSELVHDFIVPRR